MHQETVLCRSQHEMATCVRHGFAAAVAAALPQQSSYEVRLRKEAYQRDGFIVIRNALPNVTTRAIRSQLERQLHTNLASTAYSFLRLFDTVASPWHRHCVVPPLSADLASALMHVLTEQRELYTSLLEAPCDQCELVELGAIVSLPGAQCQEVHKDIGQVNCSLLTSFVALQDIDTTMGPTTIYAGTHTAEFHACVKLKRIFAAGVVYSPIGVDVDVSVDPIEELAEGPPLACTLLEGDLVLMNAKVHHFGGANQSAMPRYLMQFSLLSAMGCTCEQSICTCDRKLVRPAGFTYQLDKSAVGRTMADFIRPEAY